MWVHRGRGIMRLDGDELPVEPGTMIFAPPGVRHQFVNTGDEVMVAFYAYSPSGTESQSRMREKGLPTELPAPGTPAAASDWEEAEGPPSDGRYQMRQADGVDRPSRIAGIQA